MAEPCRERFDEIVSTALIDLLKNGTLEVKAQAVKALANLALDGSVPFLSSPFVLVLNKILYAPSL